MARKQVVAAKTMALVRSSQAWAPPRSRLAAPLKLREDCNRITCSILPFVS